MVFICFPGDKELLKLRSSELTHEDILYKVTYSPLDEGHSESLDSLTSQFSDSFVVIDNMTTSVSIVHIYLGPFFEVLYLIVCHQSTFLQFSIKQFVIVNCNF